MVFIVEYHFFFARLLGPRISHHGAGYTKEIYTNHTNRITKRFEYNISERIFTLTNQFVWHLFYPICLDLNFSPFRFCRLWIVCVTRNQFISVIAGPRAAVVYYTARLYGIVVGGWTVLLVWFSRQCSAVARLLSGIDIWLFHFVLRYRFFTVINI